MQKWIKINFVAKIFRGALLGSEIILGGAVPLHTPPPLGVRAEQTVQRLPRKTVTHTGMEKYRAGWANKN